MKILTLCLIITVFPLFGDNIDHSHTLSNSVLTNNGNETDNSISDVLFVQYRIVFRDLLSRKCVFSPSCSQYGQESIRTHGVVFGLMMALERWTRCHPASLGYGDYPETGTHTLADPVDDREESICWGQSLLPF